MSCRPVFFGTVADLKREIQKPYEGTSLSSPKAKLQIVQSIFSGTLEEYNTWRTDKIIFKRMGKSLNEVGKTGAKAWNELPEVVECREMRGMDKKIEAAEKKHDWQEEHRLRSRKADFKGRIGDCIADRILTPPSRFQPSVPNPHLIALASLFRIYRHWNDWRVSDLSKL